MCCFSFHQLENISGIMISNAFFFAPIFLPLLGNFFSVYSFLIVSVAMASKSLIFFFFTEESNLLSN